MKRPELAPIPDASGEPWSEPLIANALSRHTFGRRCLLLVDRCEWTGHECDVLAVTLDLRVIDIEIKISRADLKADARKAKWWHARSGERRTHPMHVWKHYYCMPEPVWKDGMQEFLPSEASGVIVLRRRHGQIVPVVVRRAKPARNAEKLSPEEVLDVARLANLRMWDAYERLQRSATANVAVISPQSPETSEAGASPAL